VFWGEKVGLKIRVKFLLVSLLLALALACMFFSAAGTIQAYQQFEKNHQRITSGDVSTVDSWMTLPYVAHVYHVPETCLYQSLHVLNSWPTRHETLRALADRYRRPVNQVILEVQYAILNYRKHHIICPAPSPPPTTNLSFQGPLPFTTQTGECQ
jgi:hypothetical protein